MTAAPTTPTSTQATPPAPAAAEIDHGPILPGAAGTDTGTDAATTTSSARKPRPKPARSARLVIRPERGRPGAVELTVGKCSELYLVTEIRTDLGGRAFAVEKPGAGNAGATYHVAINGDRRACDCKGGTYAGHCKHADGLAALAAAGLL